MFIAEVGQILAQMKAKQSRQVLPVQFRAERHLTQTDEEFFSSIQSRHDLPHPPVAILGDTNGR